MDQVTLYEEFRFIEKSEPEVNGAWKGAQLLLFFLAFVFGSFCTFCFHLLMYLFDEKCVLFPKLLSLTSLRQNMIYEFIPEDKETVDKLPVDFISTQWVEKSACLLPTYVPLVSGIFGLVWTTMFLMCSTGSRVLTGCTYTVNVATLAYERRIRGVYQATRLTIFSAWLHTACWVLSAFLALMRVLLAVDFKLIRVSVQLQGNIDRMLEQHERHICTVSPDTLESNHYSRSKVLMHFKKKDFHSSLMKYKQDIKKEDLGNVLYYSEVMEQISEPSLVTAERRKLDKLSACDDVPKEHQFIVKMLYNILDTVEATQDVDIPSSSSSTITEFDSSVAIARQYGQQRISSTLNQDTKKPSEELSFMDLEEAEEIAMELRRNLHEKLNKQLNEIKIPRHKKSNKESTESTMNMASDTKIAVQKKNDAESKGDSSDESEPSTSKGVKKVKLKSNLRQSGIQTEAKIKDKSVKVKIDSRTSVYSLNTAFNDPQSPRENKKTQTNKEKQE
ncbi:unnamed protein product, partial [Brenthis ino]